MPFWPKAGQLQNARLRVTSHTAILIVGAGPTGLVLACELARRNVPFRIIDRLDEPAPLARATAIKTRTLEVFAALGIVDRFLEKGLRVTAIETYAEGRLISRVGLDSVDSPYPFMLSLGQEETERILTAHLESFGVSVDRGLEFCGTEARDTMIGAIIEDREGRRSTVSAGWLVGCDGSRSAVRATMNEPLEGFDYPDSKLLALVKLSGWSNPRNTVTNFIGDGWIFNSQELPSGTYLLSGTAGDSGTRETDTPESLLAIWRNRLRQAMPGADISDAIWLNRFHIRLGVAPTYRTGHTLIAGDAAHQFSPEGAPGMNTGIQDAFNIGWKLALTATGRAPDRLLDSYETERRPVAQRAGAEADRAERALSKVKPGTGAGQELLIGSRAIAVQREMVAEVADLNHSYRHRPLARGFRAAQAPDHHRIRWPEPSPGDRLPDAFPLVRPDGSHVTLHQAAWGETLTLVLLVGASNDARLGELARFIEAVTTPFHGNVAGLVIVEADAPPDIPGFPCPIVADPNDRIHRRLGVLADTALLVRPDGYVAYRGEPPDQDDLMAYLGHLVRARAPTHP
jgi:2-polyprenyl-6-methoxyphenol hydroxylase-like FAD-dependent oxidoreductase